MSQVQKQIPYNEWLQHKKTACRSARSDDSAGRDEDGAKQRECDERFFEWVRKKQREKRTQRQDTTADKASPNAVARHDQPFVKPRSLHVNPVVKTARTKNKKHSLTVETTHSTSGKQVRATADQNAAVYAAWERRKKREDRVKRQHEQLDRQLQEHANRLLHLTRWKRKDVVCAYSTNHRVVATYPQPVAHHAHVLNA